MEDSSIDNFLDATQMLHDLSINDKENVDEILPDNDDNIDTNIDYPYIVFKRDDLIRTMNLTSKLIQVKSDIISYNSISFIPDIDKKLIYFCATNELSYFKYSAELIGEPSKMLDRSFSIPLLILQKLVKLMGNKILLYIKDNNLYIRLLDGDLLLDLREVNTKILDFPGTISDKLADLNLNSFGKIIDNIMPLLNGEIRGETRKIQFTGSKAYYNSSFYYLESDITTPRMSISYRDADFIDKLYKYYSDKQIQVFSVKSKSNINRIMIKLDNVEYEFINSVNSISDILVDQMHKMISDIEAIIDFNKLYRTVVLATNLPSSTGNVSLQFSEDKLKASITSNKGSSDFNFNIIKKEKDKLYNKEIIIRAETLRRLLSSFTEYNNIGITLSDLGITISYNGTKAVLMHTN